MGGGQLFEVDLSVPFAPRLTRQVAAPGATAVAAVAGGRACAAAASVHCYSPSGAAFTDDGQDALPAAALSAVARGPFLLVGTGQGLVVYDVRGAPRSAGFYPAMAGVAAAAGDEIFAAADDGVQRLALLRPAAAPSVSLGLPATAAPGSRLALGASIAGASDALGAFTAELRVNGQVMEVSDNRAPATVDMPTAPGSALVELRLRDLAGNTSAAQATVALVDDGSGPLLSSVVAPSAVLEGTQFRVFAVPQDPARAASVTFSIDGGAPVVVSGPELSAELTAPAESADALVTVTAVAQDAQGRSGPPTTAPVLVQHDLTPGSPLVSVQRIGSGPIYEGSAVAVQATLTPMTGVAEVRFSVDGVEQIVVDQPPFEAALTMPFVDGARNVPITAIAFDSQGRASAPGALVLTVVDDLVAPTLALTVEPSGSAVSAGSQVVATASATDAAGLERLSLTATLGGVVVGAGGDALSFAVPLSTPEGTALEVAATAMDRAGNVSTAKATRVVVGASAPVATSAAGGAFAGADRIAVLGDSVFVTTPRGVTLGRLSRGASPSLAAVAEYPTPAAPTGVAVRGGLGFVALGAQGLQVVDVSALEAPSLVSSNATAVARIGSHAGAIVASDGAHPYLVDASDPLAPKLVSLGNTSDLVSGRSALWAANGTGPGLNSIVVGDFNASGGILLSGTNIGTAPATAAERDGDLALVGTSAGLKILAGSSWANGEALTLLGTLATPSVRAMAVARGVAYLACADGMLRVVDVRNPHQPAFVSEEILDARSLVVSGGLLLAATESGIDVRTLPSPAGAPGRLATVALADVVGGLTPYRRGALAAAGGLGLLSFDVGTPTAPAQSTAFAAGNLRQVERVGREVFLVDGTTLKVVLESAGGIGLGTAPDASILSGIGGVQRIAVVPNRILVGRRRSCLLGGSAGGHGAELALALLEYRGRRGERRPRGRRAGDVRDGSGARRRPRRDSSSWARRARPRTRWRCRETWRSPAALRAWRCTTSLPGRRQALRASPPRGRCAASAW